MQAQIHNLLLVNQEGRIVWQEKPRDRYNVNMVPEGIYLLLAEGSTQTTVIGKLVKR